MLPALLFGIYPAIYFYTKNISLVLFPSLGRILVLYFVLITIIYTISLVLNRFDGVKAANATSVFMLFLNTYGIVYEFILARDVIGIKHLTFLPFFIFLAVYLGWWVTRLGKEPSLVIWRVTGIVFLGLIIFNLTTIIPAEVHKASLRQAARAETPAVQGVASEGSPDIYYLLFDEFSGLKPMREYWRTPEVDTFKDYLLEKGFFVAEDSHSVSTSTLRQTAIRLNYYEVPQVLDDKEFYYNLIGNNKAFDLVKSKGYTTVVFDEVSWLYPAIPEFNVDYLFQMDLEATGDLGLLFDDFGMLITDNTMMYAFADYYKLEDFGYTPHRNMVISTMDQLANMEDIPSPRFIYSHLMLPHRPYLFDRNGEMLDPENYKNWDYYEGYWVYTTKIIQQIVDSILEDADPQNPPVIILQSDHGARLHKAAYPLEYRTSILFAMYLPGYDTSTIPQDVNPANTLKIVFNHYLGENIPLE